MKQRSNANTVALLAATAFVAASTSAVAFDPPASTLTTWTGGATGFWNDPNNWTDDYYGHIVPEDANFHFHTAYIKTGASVTMDKPLATLTFLEMTNGSSVNVSSGNAMSLITIGGDTGSLFMQNNTTVTAYKTGAIYDGTIKLQSIDALTDFKIGSFQGDDFDNRAHIVLAGLTDGSFDRIESVTSTPVNFNNYRSVAGAGEIFGIDTFTNYDTVSGGGAVKQLLKITSNTFDNRDSGTLIVKPNGGLRIEAPNLPNMINNFIKGGTYDIAGRLILVHVDHFNSFIDTNVTLRGNAFVTNDGTHNIIYSVEMNRGKLTLTDGTSQSFGNADGLSNEDNGLVTINGNAQLNVVNRYTNGAASIGTVVGTQTGATLSPGTLKANGLQNEGKLTVLAGTADFRGGGLNTFINLSSGQEELSGKLYDLGATGTLIVDAGTSSHGGEVMRVGSDTTLTLRRGGQFQYGPSAKDALAELRENNGTLNVLAGSHTFAPAGGTFTNDTPGYLPATTPAAVMTVANANTALIVDGDFDNLKKFNVNDGANVHVLGKMTVEHDGELYVTNKAVFGADNTINNIGSLDVNNATFNAESDFVNHATAFSENGGRIAGVSIDNDGGQIGIFSGSKVLSSTTFHNGSTDPTRVGAMTIGQLNGTGDYAAFSTFQNEGIIFLNKSGILIGNQFSQSSGEMQIAGGSAQVPDFGIGGGAVDGFGSILGDVKNTAGYVQAKDGNIAITGDYDQSSAATLAALIGFDHYVTLTGDVDLAGLLNVTTAPGLNIAPGDTFEILHFDGTLTGNFTSFDFPVIDGVKLTEVVGPHDITLLAVVPEPTTLLATSFVFAAIVRRRK